MANLTITVDDETLRRARLRALEEGSSVNAVLRGYLETYSRRAGEQREALMDLLEMADGAATSGGVQRWTRDDLHERV